MTGLKIKSPKLIKMPHKHSFFSLFFFLFLYSCLSGSKHRNIPRRSELRSIECHIGLSKRNSSSLIRLQFRPCLDVLRHFPHRWRYISVQFAQRQNGRQGSTGQHRSIKYTQYSILTVSVLLFDQLVERKRLNPDSVCHILSTSG